MRTDVKRRGWTISAEGNDLADRFLESVFFTGNGRMGARGYPAYRPIRRPLDAGLFLAGFYDRISDSTELTDFVNLPTPIWYQIRLNGRIPAIPSHLSRALDLRTGLLTFRYRLSIADDWVDVQEQRFFSLAKPSFLFQRLEFQGRGQVELLAGIDHQSCNSPIPDDQVKENTQIIHAIEAHHGDVEPKTPLAFIIQAADAISAARPGARRENVESYVKRLENLEEISSSFEGVEQAFAVQAGREVRILVKPDVISDDQVILLARAIAKKIEDTLDYPGQIKVNVIRESRAVEYAK